MHLAMRLTFTISFRIIKSMIPTIDSATIFQNLSILVGLLGTGGLVGLLIWLWKSGKFFGKLEEKLGVISKLENHFNQITNAIVEIQTHLTSRGYTINQRIVLTSSSPTRLTDYGEQLMQETGFYKIAETNQRILTDLVRAKNPKTNYDIQESSLQTLKDLAVSNNPILDPLKNYAFQKGLVLDVILQAAAIVLRDIVMQELKFEDETLEGKG